MSFKIGEMIKCVEDIGTAKAGEIYEVVDLWGENHPVVLVGGLRVRNWTMRYESISAPHHPYLELFL